MRSSLSKLCLKSIHVLALVSGLVSLSACDSFKLTGAFGDNSVSKVSLVTPGAGHQVGAQAVYLRGWCEYGSTIDAAYDSGFAPASAQHTTCVECSKTENAACSKDTNGIGKFELRAELQGLSGTRTVTLKQTDSVGNISEISSQTFNYSPLAQTAFLKAAYAGSTSPDFGNSLDVDGDTLVVGASNEAGDSNMISNSTTHPKRPVLSGAGAVYVFKRVAGLWAQEAYLKPPYTHGGAFGAAVAISGDRILVGSPNDKNSTAGIQNAPAPVSNTLLTSSGAVFTFKRTGNLWAFESLLKAPNPDVDDKFGMSVALSGTTAIVGANSEDSAVTSITNGATASTDNTADSAGAAYVFVNTAGTWSQQAFLKASNAEAGDKFGTSVDISGDAIVVGAISEDSNVNGPTNGAPGSSNNALSATGAAYVFRRTAGLWSEEAYLKGSNISANDTFGMDVAISGDTIVVGADSEDSNVTGVLNGTAGSTNNTVSSAGAAYVFNRSAGLWTQQAYLKQANVSATDRFGRYVDIDGDLIAVGSSGEDSNSSSIVNGSTGSADDSAVNSGAVTVFSRTGSTWAQSAYIKASNADAADLFGSAVAISGSFLAISATSEAGSTTGVVNGPTALTNNLAPDNGAVYGFELTAGNWAQSAYIKSSIFADITRFGTAVSMDGDTLVVGASSDDDGTMGVLNAPSVTKTGFAANTGAVYVFKKSGSTWAQEAFIKPLASAMNDSFGVAVSIDGDTIAVGSTGEDSSIAGVTNSAVGGPDELASGSGAVYVYKRTGLAWAQEAFIKSPFPDAGDAFGVTLQLSGDLLIVGAQGEDNNVAGVTNGTGGSSDNSMNASGAAYVFKRTGSTWAQEAFLKPSDPGLNDAFGSLVSISGETVIVNARGESGNVGGVVNGSSATSNDLAVNSGAVYVFSRSAGLWSQQAKLKSPVPNSGDFFGSSLAISGDVIAVNAQFDDSGCKGVQIQKVCAPTAASVDSGTTFIFRRSASTWSQWAIIKDENTPLSQATAVRALTSNYLMTAGTGDFETGTGVSDPYLPIGAENLTRSGAVRIYKLTSDSLQPIALIRSPSPASYDEFGSKATISGNSIVVSAPYDDNGTFGITNAPGVPTGSPKAYLSGAVYTYELTP